MFFIPNACSSTPGTPKSDFHFLDLEGKEIVWMSHKDGSKASDFQQWGGISKNVPNTHNHKETKEFLGDLKENFEDGDWYIGVWNSVYFFEQKHAELFLLKCFIEEEYEKLPKFNGEEAWQHERLIQRLKQK